MGNDNSLTDMEQQRLEELALRRLPIWSWYIKGARNMLLKLREHLLTYEPWVLQGQKVGVEKDDKVLNKAILDMIISDPRKIDLFLHEGHDGIRFKNHQYDKKGKLVSVEAYFAKKKITYEEI